MIDNIKAREIFKEFAKKYDVTNPRIALKVAHTYRVADLSKEISKSIPGADVELAELIGLLHDIGRLEQLKRFDSFDDKIIDHATIGIEILTANDNELLTEFCPDKSYHDTIITAIRNHNLYMIKDGIEGDALTQCKIIRDADKIDILNIGQFESFETLYKVKEIKQYDITPIVYESVFTDVPILRKELVTFMDQWICSICLVSGIYYKQSFRILKEKNYVNNLLDRVEYEKNQNKIEKIREHLNKYIEDHAK